MECCRDMEILGLKENIVSYNKIFREYYFTSNKGNVITTLSYCPWCGSKLSKDLREEFFNALETEYNLDLSIADIKDCKILPEEFTTDEWWKKRKL